MKIERKGFTVSKSTLNMRGIIIFGHYEYGQGIAQQAYVRRLIYGNSPGDFGDMWVRSE